MYEAKIRLVTGWKHWVLWLLLTSCDWHSTVTWQNDFENKAALARDLVKSLFRWVMSLSALRRCHATSRGTAIHNVRGGKSAIMHDLTGYDPMLYHLLSLLVIYNPHGPRQITPTSLTDRVKFPYMDSLDIFKCEWHIEFGTFSFKISVFLFFFYSTPKSCIAKLSWNSWIRGEKLPLSLIF